MKVLPAVAGYLELCTFICKCTVHVHKLLRNIHVQWRKCKDYTTKDTGINTCRYKIQKTNIQPTWIPQTLLWTQLTDITHRPIVYISLLHTHLHTNKHIHTYTKTHTRSHKQALTTRILTPHNAQACTHNTHIHTQTHNHKHMLSHKHARMHKHNTHTTYIPHTYAHNTHAHTHIYTHAQKIVWNMQCI